LEEKSMKKLAPAVCLWFVFSTAAFASTTVQFIDVYGQTVNVISPYYSGGVNAGIYHINMDSILRNSFCIDIADWVATEPQPYSVLPLEDTPDPVAGPMGIAKATAIGKLWAMAYSPTMTQNQAAAFQLAVWDCVTDLDYNVTSGNFRVSGGDYGAQALLNNLQTYSGAGANLLGLSSPNYQDYVIAGPPASVPVPGAMGLGSLGLGVLGWLRSRRRI
jgi:hypothetical protein